jgi:uncharacterized protein YcsI (UPF0317 family)
MKEDVTDVEEYWREDSVAFLSEFKFGLLAGF